MMADQANPNAAQQLLYVMGGGADALIERVDGFTSAEASREGAHQQRSTFRVA